MRDLRRYARQTQVRLILGALFLLFMRFLPMITMFEVKAIMPAASAHPPGHGHDAAPHPSEGAKA